MTDSATELQALEKALQNPTEVKSFADKDIATEAPFHIFSHGQAGEDELFPSLSPQQPWDPNQVLPLLISSVGPLGHGRPGPVDVTSILSAGETDLQRLDQERLFEPLWQLNAEGAPTLSAKVSENFRIAPCGPVTHFELQRDFEGLLVGFTETEIYEEGSAATSTSLLRKSGRMSDFARGSVSYVPFRPGGLEQRKLLRRDHATASLSDLFPFSPEQRHKLLVPPGVGGGLSGEGRETEGSKVAALYQPASNAQGLLEEAGKVVEPIITQRSKTQSLSDLEIDSVVSELRELLPAEADEMEWGEPDYKRSATHATSANKLQPHSFVHQRDRNQASKATAEVPEGALEALLATEVPLQDVVFNMKKTQQQGIKRQWARTESIDTSRFHEEVPNMAIQFPFQLDAFQKEAILHLERNESVFVAAHTSAGKTVVAEYAIALSNKHLTRAIYTSPIKTLSNQKFREFRQTFGETDVGILTGDVSINPEAPCLILTTEILRSMLYRGADLIRDIEWVIFDEVHYVNDPERGVVWEEVIIMLPDHVNIILLSATVPNVAEFADWVGRTKKKNIYVISTHKRPVPLQHFLWAKKKLWKIKDQTGKWITESFREARLEGEVKKPAKPLKPGERRKEPFKKNFRAPDKNHWIGLVQFLEKKELLPVAVFAFSKKMVEQCASGLQGLDLTTSQEKSAIHRFCKVALSNLQVVDRDLPQIRRVVDLCKRGIGIHHAGIGIHHAGMLPILKEIVEMVFQRGYGKVLFATETFAMGVNMPTKTVVFQSTRKHDGKEFRDLTPGEYTQMAGRAGRRGLDTFGVVIVNCMGDTIPEELDLKRIITGTPTKLESRFRLTYNMILNLLRQEDMKVEDMIKRSFSEAWMQRQAPDQKKLLEQGQKHLERLRDAECEKHDAQSMHEYFFLWSELNEMDKRLMTAVMTIRKLVAKFLSPGRVLLVRKYHISNALGVVLSARGELKSAGSDRIDFKVLMLCPEGYVMPAQLQRRIHNSQGSITTGAVAGAQYLIVSLEPADLIGVCKHKINFDPSSIMDHTEPTQETANVVKELQQLSSKYKPLSRLTAPLIDVESDALQTDMQLADDAYVRKQVSKQLSASVCHSCPNLNDHLDVLTTKSQLNERLSLLQRTLSDDNVELIADFNLRLVVLEKLNYIASDRTVQLKGRVACECDTCDSIIMTEIIFENILKDLQPDEIVALLSCLIFKQKSDNKPELTPTLEKGLQAIQKVGLSVGTLQRSCGMMGVSPEEYMRENINPGLMQVTYEWAKGTPFAKICEFTDVLEGSIVRSIVRLDELCRDVRNSARVIGDPKLYQTMTAASELIKRDIVFAASLYVQQRAAGLLTGQPLSKEESTFKNQRDPLKRGTSDGGDAGSPILNLLSTHRSLSLCSTPATARTTNPRTYNHDQRPIQPHLSSQHLRPWFTRAWEVLSYGQNPEATRPCDAPLWERRVFYVPRQGTHYNLNNDPINHDDFHSQ
eukprot:g78639.t1